MSKTETFEATEEQLYEYLRFLGVGDKQSRGILKLEAADAINAHPIEDFSKDLAVELSDQAEITLDKIQADTTPTLRQDFVRAVFEIAMSAKAQNDGRFETRISKNTYEFKRGVADVEALLRELALVVDDNIIDKIYKKQNIDSETLSKAIEDAVTFLDTNDKMLIESDLYGDMLATTDKGPKEVQEINKQALLAMAKSKPALPRFKGDIRFQFTHEQALGSVIRVENLFEARIMFKILGIKDTNVQDQIIETVMAKQTLDAKLAVLRPIAEKLGRGETI
jgi:hypothetical protein